MNNVILPAPHRLAPLIPSVESLVLARGGTLCDRYELEDTILRAGGYAWDIGTDAAPLHAQIAAVTKAEADAQAAADAERLANPPPVMRAQETRTILDRLTKAEGIALMDCTVPEIKLLVFKATATGTIQEDDKDFPAAKAGLNALGIIAADRWEALFAP